MQPPDLESAPILFGTGGLFGIRTTPAEQSGAAALLMLNAGMLPCAGPFRLHVDIARAVGGLGMTSVRLDQSGKGESPARSGVTATESVLRDYDEVFAELSRSGIEHTIVLGMCSGAVDALRIAEQRHSVVGLVLLDGFVGLTAGWYLHHYAARLGNFLAHGPFARLRRLFVERPPAFDEASSSILTDLRNWGTLDLRPAYTDVLRRNAKILSIFTGDFYPYNHAGQLRKYLGADSAGENLDELFFSDADHTYTLTQHREWLVTKVCDWLQSGFGERGRRWVKCLISTVAARSSRCLSGATIFSPSAPVT